LRVIGVRLEALEERLPVRHIQLAPVERVESNGSMARLALSEPSPSSRRDLIHDKHDL